VLRVARQRIHIGQLGPQVLIPGLFGHFQQFRVHKRLSTTGKSAGEHNYRK
jgi:hypothetical protein